MASVNGWRCDVLVFGVSSFSAPASSVLIRDEGWAGENRGGRAAVSDVPLDRDGSRRSHGRPLADGWAVVARAARRPRVPGRRPRGHARVGRRRQLCQSRRSDARDSGALTSRPARRHRATHLPPGLAPRPHGSQACAQLRGGPLADRCPRRALHARRRRRAPRPHACHPPRRRLLGIQPRRRHRRPRRGNPMRGQRLAADDRLLRFQPA